MRGKWSVTILPQGASLSALPSIFPPCARDGVELPLVVWMRSQGLGFGNGRERRVCEGDDGCWAGVLDDADAVDVCGSYG